MNRLIKLLITAFLVLACLILPASCGSQVPVAASVDCPQPCKPVTPQILFVSKEHDFGKVRA